MPSTALHAWQSARRQRLQNLFDAYVALGDSDSEDHWKTEQVTWALVLLLAAEFQGFCRDLHDQAGIAFARATACENLRLERVLRDQLAHNRVLDRGNAHPGSLGADYDRLGMELWGALNTQWPVEANEWKRTLTGLNDARNAIAHSHGGKVAALDLQLSTVQTWRSSLDGLAVAMDNIVGEYLAGMFGSIDPWA